MLTLVFALAWADVLPFEPEPPPVEEKAPEPPPRPVAAAPVDWNVAFTLPQRAQDLRDRGIPSVELDLMLTGLRGGKVPPDTGARVLEAVARAHDLTGTFKPVGLFVVDRVAKGYQGDELVAQIERFCDPKGASSPGTSEP